MRSSAPGEGNVRPCLKSPSPLLNGCRGVQRVVRGIGMTKPDGTGFFAISDIR